MTLELALTATVRPTTTPLRQRRSFRRGARHPAVCGNGEISTLSAMLLVAVMTVYFLAAMPMTKVFFYRLIPHSRRPRVILIGDEIFTKVGGYVLGNLITSFIAGAGTFLWMLAFGIPYPRWPA